MTSFNEKQDEFDALLDSYLAELVATSDDEVLGGEDPAALKARGMGVLAAAKAEAGRRRLMVAKAKLAIRQSLGEPSLSAGRPRIFAKGIKRPAFYVGCARIG